MPEQKKNQESGFRTRTFSVGSGTNGGAPSTLNEENRSVELTILSETREVLTYDWDLGPVPEILVMSGGRLPENGQVPLIDSHDRYSVKSVLGSVRDLSFEGDRLSGRAFYSSVDSAQEAFTKLKEGHLTDYSGGFRIHKIMKLDENQNTEISGRVYEGPAVLVTEWTLNEVSTCPIGADSSAKARTETINTDKENKTMPGTIEETEGTRGETVKPVPAAGTPSPAVNVENERREAANAARAEEQDRIRTISALCEKHNCRELIDPMISDGKTVDQARADVLALIETRAAGQEQEKPGFRAEVIVDGRDKFRMAATDALIVRAGLVAIGQRNALALGYDELMGFSQVELARRFLLYANQSDRGTPMEVVGRALTSSDFPLALANIANKALGLGYESAGETWQQWAGVGTVNDFKTHTLVRVSESDDLEEIREHGEYKYGTLDENQEQYKIATYGKKFIISRVAIINDDLSALTDIPARHGEAAARKIGDIAYAVLTANSAMGDGVALFHATHKNLAETASEIGMAGMAAGIKAMALQKDMKGKRSLNIRPEFVLAPRSLEASAEVFFSSEKFDAASSGSTRTNIYAGNKFTRVYEARLDDDSVNAWYLLSSKGKTVKVFFLGGNMAPYMETRQGWNVDGVEYKVRIDAGAKALDWKTLYKNSGVVL